MHTRKAPQGVVRDDQPDAREGQSGRPCAMAERLAVLMKQPGNAAGGKGPLLVMGAYDHPAALGDTSQALLERAAVPILMSH